MAVDRDRIVYTAEKVKEILREKKDREKAEKVLFVCDEELNFLKKCLEVLEDGERDILEKIYFEGISIRKYAKLSGFSRNFINNKIAKSIELLTKFFNLKFN